MDEQPAQSLNQFVADRRRKGLPARQRNRYRGRGGTTGGAEVWNMVRLRPEMRIRDGRANRPRRGEPIAILSAAKSQVSIPDREWEWSGVVWFVA